MTCIVPIEWAKRLWSADGCRSDANPNCWIRRNRWSAGNFSKPSRVPRRPHTSSSSIAPWTASN